MCIIEYYSFNWNKLKCILNLGNIWEEQTHSEIEISTKIQFDWI